MLRGTGLNGFMGKNGDVTPTYVTAALNNSDLTTYTFSTLSIGTVYPDRYIAIVAGGRQTSSVTINTCTVGGISTTRVASLAGTINLAIFITDIPVLSGTTASVAVTCSATNSRLGVASYQLTGVRFRPQVTGTISTTGSSGNINVAAKGCILAGGYNLGNAISWTNMTENSEQTLEGPNVFSTALYDAGASETRTITATNATGLCAAAFSWS